jgi:hypothetical protein
VVHRRLLAIWDVRTIALVLPAVLLAALWVQSYFGGFVWHQWGLSEDGWFTFVIAGVHGAIGIPIPYWITTVPAIAIAVYAVRSAIRRLPPVPGLCPACGYDIRATPERCPECGAVLASHINDGIDKSV